MNNLTFLKVFTAFFVFVAVIVGVAVIGSYKSRTITYTCAPGEILVVSMNPNYPQEDRYLYACVTGGPAHKVVTEH